MWSIRNEGWLVKMVFRFFTCLKYSLDKKSKVSQCAKNNKFIWCCISVKFQFEMVVLKVLREFAGGTSIHGFTFLVRPESSSWTKIIWTICLAVALTYATLEMRNSVVGKYDYITKFISFMIHQVFEIWGFWKCRLCKYAVLNLR